ncbi:MAG: T9SS type A sorting domain-containing protein [Rhodothermales bacterium]
MSFRTIGAVALFIFAFTAVSRAQVLEADSLALVALYNATDGASWTDHTGWLSGPVGTWFGVTIGNGRVTGIELHDNNLVGSVPTDVANLDSLEFLRLYSDDGLTGPIPPELGGLTKLWDLQLYRANFTGPIPPELGNLSHLERLFLLNNNLTGTIPLEILNIGPLRDLLINHNQLEGEIPPEIGNLTNLERLWLDFNNLTGELPDEVGNLTKLTNLFIQNTDLEGPLPQSLTNLPAALRFRWNSTGLCEPTNTEFQNWIDGIAESTGNNTFCEGGETAGVAEADSMALVALYNSTDGANWTENEGWLAGPVLLWHGVTVSQGRVQKIELGGNGLSGPLPAALGNLDSLQTLSLYSNNLTGPIPPELGNLSALGILVLNGNALTGGVPPELGDLSHLEKLYLSSNNLSGDLPAELGNLSALSILILEDNNFGGQIPASFTNLTSLTQFSILATGVCEPTDAAIQNWLQGIQTVSLSGLDCVSGSFETDSLALVAFYDSLGGPGWTDNTGWLTDSLANWTGITVSSGRVTQIILNANGLSGRIPSAIGDLTNLKILSISNDSLGGTIPPEIWNLTNLTYVALNYLGFTGTLSPDLGNLTKLGTLSFDGNHLEGSIPDEIRNLTNLAGLFLSGNNLTGPLPESIGTLTQLRRVEVSGNAFEGELPSSLTNLTSLNDLFLGSNQFSGAIPSDIGDLTALKRLSLSRNNFTGAVPESIGNLVNLTTLFLGSNDGLTGPLPLSLENLTNLTAFYYSSTGLCAPDDADFAAWLDGIQSVGSTGVTCSTTAVEDSPDVPTAYRLGANYPNPFNPATTISYDLPERARVHLSIHDMLGREIRILVDETQPAGTYATSFDAKSLPSGLYIYRLRAGSFDKTGTMMLVK